MRDAPDSAADDPVTTSPPGLVRGAHLALGPDMASLATGSVNFPTRVYDNAPDLVDWLAGEMLERQIKPEIEAFDLSMIFQAARMQAQQRIAGALHVQFVMGIHNAMPADRRVFEFYVETLGRLSPTATFTGAGIGRDALTVARWSMELGGHVRTGMEDNVRLDRHTLAPSNAALVEQVARLMPEYGRHVASVAQARTILGLCRCSRPGRASSLRAIRRSSWRIGTFQKLDWSGASARSPMMRCPKGLAAEQYGGFRHASLFVSWVRRACLLTWPRPRHFASRLAPVPVLFAGLHEDISHALP